MLVPAPLIGVAISAFYALFFCIRNPETGLVPFPFDWIANMNIHAIIPGPSPRAPPAPDFVDPVLWASPTPTPTPSPSPPSDPGDFANSTAGSEDHQAPPDQSSSPPFFEAPKAVFSFWTDLLATIFLVLNDFFKTPIQLPGR